MRPVCLWGFSKLVMGSPKPSGIIKPSVPSKLAKNVDGKWPQANGNAMRGNRLIVRSYKKISIKGKRRVLHQTDKRSSCTVVNDDENGAESNEGAFSRSSFPRPSLLAKRQH